MPQGQCHNIFPVCDGSGNCEQISPSHGSDQIFSMVCKHPRSLVTRDVLQAFKDHLTLEYIVLLIQ